MYKVFPRLSTAEAAAKIEQLKTLSECDRRNLVELDHPGVFYAQGPRVSFEALGEVRDEVREKLGPLMDAGSADAKFDRSLGEILYERLPLSPYEASTKEVWNFLSTMVMPEIAPWRFPKWTRDRVLGVPLRNALSRTWWRAHLLGPDLAVGNSGAEPLGENELYALVEKTTIGMNRTLVRACARIIYAHQATANSRDVFVEEFTKELLKRMPSRHLGSMRDSALDQELQSIAEIVSGR